MLHDWPTSEGSYRDDYSVPYTAYDVSDIMLQTMGIYKVCNYFMVDIMQLYDGVTAHSRLAGCSG